MRFILNNNVELVNVKKVNNNENKLFYTGFFNVSKKTYIVNISKYGNCFSIKDITSKKQLLSKENKRDFSVKKELKLEYFPKYKKELEYERIGIFDIDYILDKIPLNYVTSEFEINPYIENIENIGHIENIRKYRNPEKWSI